MTVGKRPARSISHWYGEMGLAFAILVVIALTAFLDPQHTYLHNALPSAVNVARLTAFLGIFALGAAVVIISGGIDLSSGSMIAFSGTICATLLVLLDPENMNPVAATRQPLSWITISLSIAGALVAGLLVGTLHAWLIAVMRLPPFIATLGTLVGLRSLGRAIVAHVTERMYNAASTQIQIPDERFRYLANFVWIPIAVFLVLVVVLWILLSRTVVGRHIYALGGNEQAARLSGIRTERVKWLVYVIGSFTAAVAGVLYIGEQSTADPQTLAVGYELNAIAAAVVGGCSLQGGIGTVPGIVLGALFLQTVIDAVAKIIKVDADTYQGIIVGLVLITAAALGQIRTMRGRGQQVFPGWLDWAAIVTLSALAGILVAVFFRERAGDRMALVTAGVVLVALTALKLLNRTRKAEIS